MTTINEDYVSFEIAKLLKDKGFAEKCRTYFKVFPKDRIAAIYHSSENRGVSEDDPNEILCPTLQMAMKWMREVHKIGIFPSTYTFTIGYGTEEHHPYGTAIINLVTYKLITNDIMPRDSYEEACEAAIKYCLENLI